MCPLSMARSDSPCIDTSAWMPSASANDCNNYATTTERTNCRNASQAYCDAVCPTTCAGPSCTATGACADGGCLSLGRFSAMAASTTNWTGAAAGGAAADPFKIRTVASSGMNGPVLAGDGSVASAVAVFGYYALNDDRSMIDGSEEDPVASEWEKHALCALGIKYDSRDDAFVCPEDDLLDFKVNFQRSFEDEFGAAIRGDVAGLGISYMAILIYFIVMLSRRDHVHSMIGMGIVTLLTVGLSFGAGMGLGALFGIPNNQLTNNIPFLLLGLGVDDAFVLSSEFQRIKRQRPSNSVVDNIVTTARHGGVSILITSATDALAFLVGSATVLPALAGFCQFAGIGVIICFILQLTFFLPALALNARRANDNRYDVICCSKASEKHHFEEERGCCFCCRCKSGQLPRAMRRFGEAITSRIGAAAVIVLFLAIMGVGLAGSLQIYKDFRLEWFFPDDSYVNVYFKWNREYFSAGTPVSIYTRDINYFQAQPSMQRLSGYLNTSDFVDPSEQVNDWHDAFLRDASSTAFVNAQGVYTSESDYYTQLHGWWASGAGVRYQSQLKWVDTTCDNATATTCDASRGIKASKLGATLKLEYTDKGQIRYDTMDTMRSEIATIMADYGGSRNFPFSYQFLYWEEVGIIDVELARNIIICAVVIATMVFMMVPHPRISVWVILSILLSINSLCGFMHWWGVTISGVSTIYILISVGLAVDYSAHIAHMFVESTGTSRERAIAALERIGPSVFNAVVSTMLAVIVVGFSKSYVFRVFFKALFLTVLLGGAHGLVFLPTVLSLLGGSKAAPPAAAKKKGVELVGTKVSM